MIGHDIAAALPTLRAEAESLMVSPCELQRKDGHTIDPGNGQRTDLWVTYWSGGCKLKTSTAAVESGVGGQLVTVRRVNAGIPWDAPQPTTDDRIVTSEGIFYVDGVGHHSSPIMRRFTAAEHQG